MIKYYCDICGAEINKNVFKVKKHIDKDFIFNLDVSCIGKITVDTDELLMKTIHSPGIICLACLKQFIQ